METALSKNNPALKSREDALRQLLGEQYLNQLVIYLQVTRRLSIVSLLVSLIFVSAAIMDKSIINVGSMFLPTISNMVTGLLFVQVRFLSKRVQEVSDLDFLLETVARINDGTLRDQAYAEIVHNEVVSKKESLLRPFNSKKIFGK